MLTISDRPKLDARPQAGDGHLTLLAGAFLFRKGDARVHVYRVETGSVCLFTQRPDGTLDVLEFAFPGDLVGLGYLGSHASDAQATMDTSLTCLSRPNVQPARTKGSDGMGGLTLAIEREVALLNGAQRRRSIAKPLGRVAALFVTLARCNAYEGRDPTLLTDSLSCGVVAGYLDMSVDDLAHWLTQLKARGLVEACERGLRLTDLDELKQLADAAD